MFKQETVFILGAGASWHYGYPTGEQLVKRVIKTAHQVGQYLRETTIVPMPLYVAEVPHQAGSYTKQFYLAAAQECYSLAKQLELINPLVIDYFLADHCSLRRIGKLMIALGTLGLRESNMRSTGSILTDKMRNHQAKGRMIGTDFSSIASRLDAKVRPTFLKTR